MIKWLYPGMQVKRWLGLAVAGLVLLSLATAMGIAWVYRQVAFPADLTAPIQALTLQFVPHPYREACIGLAGLGLVVFASVQLSRSLLGALLPAEPPGRRRSLVERIYQSRSGARGPRIVAIGGGTGLSTMLRGLKKHSGNITAILTVGDDGGSTGRLRRDMGILPPGDFRNCIVALADTEPLMADLFQHRFGAESGDGLAGHSFGNLFIAAMIGVTGDFERAVAETSRVLAVRGQVYPSTLADVSLGAELADGRCIIGESAIGAGGSAIRRVFLQPERPKAYPAAIRAIQEADLIILGPGSLYTSLLPNLLVEEIASAVRRSAAVKVFICNAATQPGETAGYSVEDHVAALIDHIGGGLFNHILVNDNFTAVDKIMPEWGVQAVDRAHSEQFLHGARVVPADVVNLNWPLRHDPDKLANRLLQLWQEQSGWPVGRRPAAYLRRSEAARAVPR